MRNLQQQRRPGALVVAVVGVESGCRAAVDSRLRTVYNRSFVAESADTFAGYTCGGTWTEGWFCLLGGARPEYPATRNYRGITWSVLVPDVG